MDNTIRALCKTIAEYHEIHAKCFSLTPEECKEQMTMDFPVLQGFSVQSLVRKVGEMPFNSKDVVAELKAYKASSNSDYAEIATKISKLVHDSCNNVPHDIGMTILNAIRAEFA